MLFLLKERLFGMCFERARGYFEVGKHPPPDGEEIKEVGMGQLGVHIIRFPHKAVLQGSWEWCMISFRLKHFVCEML